MVDQHPARCTYDTNSSTLHCVPDTSSCVLETCGPCEHCKAIFYLLPGQRRLNGTWRFISHCFPLEMHYESPDCESNGILFADRCVGVQPVQPDKQDTVLSGMLPFLTLSCACTEPECTALSAEIRFDFVPDPPTTTVDSTTTTVDSTTTGNTITGNISVSLEPEVVFLGR